MKNVCIIGAGNIGSRHLQGLKKVHFPLSIEVVDPSVESLGVAKERYDQVQSLTKHKISFFKSINNISKRMDLAIIATSSNVRRKVLENLLSKSSAKYLILEKILFQKDKDYFDMEKLFKNRGTKTWVNFSMRTMPFYSDLKGKVKGKVQMIVSGSQYGLITNAIHFVDYIAYLTNCYEFTLHSTALDPEPIGSKRKGFLELNGTLNVYFPDGSSGSFVCYHKGNTPFLIELFSENFRCISKESEKKAWISRLENEWRWTETDIDIPYQSDMTNIVVEDILKTGKCLLTPYDKAVKLHLQLLESLLKFLNSSGKKFSLYPFT